MYEIVIDQSVTTYIAAEAQQNPRVNQFWEDVLNRLRIIGAREATNLPPIGGEMYTIVAEGIPTYFIPTIQILFQMSGTRIAIHHTSVWQEGDFLDQI